MDSPYNGEVSVAEDSDFNRLKKLAECDDGWRLEYKRKLTTVWSKTNVHSDFRMIKLLTVYPEIPAPVLYDVLHDTSYRRIWDDTTVECEDRWCINPNNDLGYHATKCPAPIKNRDFVLHRAWLENGRGDYFILSHSVNHRDVPPRRGFVRAISYMTGYYIKALSKKGCQLAYVAQVDPKGKLPAWTVNRAACVVAPRMVKKLSRACYGYDSWKSQQSRPNWKPWLYPEQMSLPRLNYERIATMSQLYNAELVDESNIEIGDTEELVSADADDDGEPVDDLQEIRNAKAQAKAKSKSRAQ